MNVFIDPVFNKYYQQRPLILVDIGARGGLQSNWKRASKYLQVIGFEPDQQEFVRLANSMTSNSMRQLNTALYKEEKSLDFHLMRERGNSSILRPNQAFLNRFPESEKYDILETIQCKADSLDSQLSRAQIEDVDFIKIDTQGSELFILEGATRTLSSAVLGLEVEVAFAQIYENQPVFSYVDDFVGKLGFQLFDLKPYYWKRNSGKLFGGKKGQIIFADALYIRTPEGFAQVLYRIQDDILKKSKALHNLSICILYGYLDYAVEMLETTGGLFDKEEEQLLLKSLKSEIPFASKMPNFPGRGRLASLLYALYKIIEPTYHGWATSGKILGNLEHRVW